MVPNCEIFGTTNDALREAAVGIEKKIREKLFVLLWCRGANKIFLYNIVILYYYQRNIWKFLFFFFGKTGNNIKTKPPKELQDKACAHTNQRHQPPNN